MTCSQGKVIKLCFGFVWIVSGLLRLREKQRFRWSLSLSLSLSYSLILLFCLCFCLPSLGPCHCLSPCLFLSVYICFSLFLSVMSVSAVFLSTIFMSATFVCLCSCPSNSLPLSVSPFVSFCLFLSLFLSIGPCPVCLVCLFVILILSITVFLFIRLAVRPLSVSAHVSPKGVPTSYSQTWILT